MISLSDIDYYPNLKIVFIMRKLLLVLSLVILSGCSPKTYFISNSDAYLSYNRAQGSWELIWTWKVAKGKERTDTIKVIEKDSLTFSHE